MEETLQQKAMRELESMLPPTTEDVITAMFSEKEQEQWDNMKKMDNLPLYQRLLLRPEEQESLRKWKAFLNAELTTGQYSDMRLKYMQQHQPHTLMFLTAQEQLNEHLSQIQQSVEAGVRDMIRNQAMQDEEWLKAVEVEDYAQKNRLYENYQITAEEELTRMWIYTEPEEIME